DMEFSCGATLAKWAAAGCEITVVLCTSGNVGTHDDVKFTKASLLKTREREQRNAIKHLGIKHLEFLRHNDCQLVADLTLRKELVGLLRRYKPDVVLCGDPNMVFWGDNRINHPDHRAAATAAIDAVFPCCEMELLWPKLGKAHKVHGIYVRANDGLNTWIDVSDTVQAKIKALREHHCQLDEMTDLETMIQQRLADTGKEKGLAAAEAFRVIRLIEDHEVVQAEQDKK
ncbi:MAG TPA: PIG-L deacetylase family protein, partial [Anaerolineae bacterium]|nr:PIG-L deacetylase family protein [Anaerolineae bacterium]